MGRLSSNCWIKWNPVVFVSSNDVSWFVVGVGAACTFIIWFMIWHIRDLEWDKGIRVKWRNVEVLMHQEVLGMWSAPCFVPEASPDSTRASAWPFSSNKDSSIHKGLHYPPFGSKASFHRCEQLESISCINKHSSCVWTYPWDVISDRTCLQFIPSLLKNRLLIPV